jgi:hypothetical protein
MNIELWALRTEQLQDAEYYTPTNALIIYYKEEEDVINYWMTLRTGEDTLI